VASFCLTLCMLRSLKLPNGFWYGFEKDWVIQEEGLYNIHHKVNKYFNISIAPVRSRGGLLVNNKYGSLNSEHIPYEKCHYLEITCRIFKIRITVEVSNWLLLIGLNSDWYMYWRMKSMVDFKKNFWPMMRCA
jgi:hypothetical protein